MPTFDIVSQVDSMELENAVNQAKKELATRFDFKGSKAEIVLETNEIRLSAEDKFKILEGEDLVEDLSVLLDMTEKASDLIDQIVLRETEDEEARVHTAVAVVTCWHPDQHTNDRDVCSF